MSRGAAIPISLCALRQVLGLPAHLVIEGVVQNESDRCKDQIRLLVTGPYCPAHDEGTVFPELDIVYAKLETGGATVLAINGLDT